MFLLILPKSAELLKNLKKYFRKYIIATVSLFIVAFLNNFLQNSNHVFIDSIRSGELLKKVSLFDSFISDSRYKCLVFVSLNFITILTDDSISFEFVMLTIPI